MREEQGSGVAGVRCMGRPRASVPVGVWARLALTKRVDDGERKSSKERTRLEKTKEK